MGVKIMFYRETLHSQRKEGDVTEISIDNIRHCRVNGFGHFLTWTFFCKYTFTNITAFTVATVMGGQSGK